MIRFLVLLAICMLYCPVSALAAETPAQPDRIILFNNTATIYCSETVTPVNGEISVVLPMGASDLAIADPEIRVLGMTSEIVPIETASVHALKSKSLLERKVVLESEIQSIETQVKILSMPPTELNVQGILALRQEASDFLPELLQRLAQKREELDILEKQSREVGPFPQTGIKIMITLDAPKKKLPISYSYVLHGAGWKPSYRFNVVPDRKIIEATLEAEVWQHSGIDWDQPKIRLVNGNPSRLKPGGLPQWQIGNFEAEKKKSPALNFDAAPTLMSAEAGVSFSNGAMQNRNSIYASWDLSGRSFPEGKMTMPILKTEMASSLEWIAYPKAGMTLAWMTSGFNMPETSSWPSGDASYFVNSAFVGRGIFEPAQEKMFFGQDPRVTVSGRIEKRQKSESGIIARDNNWDWNWIYEIKNSHPDAIKAHVERPMPQVLDKKITVSVKNEPKAEESQKEHCYYWNFEIGPGDTAEIRHDITISAPSETTLKPYMP